MANDMLVLVSCAFTQHCQRASRKASKGLQGTLMMIISATFALSMRGGDVLGTWIYGLSPAHGFQYCVLAITLSYALILPVIPFLPQYITASPDGERNPEEEALVLREVADEETP